MKKTAWLIWLLLTTSCTLVNTVAQPSATALPASTIKLTSIPPSPIVTPTPQPTRTPAANVDGILTYDLSPRMIALLQSAMDRLKQCAPDMWEYVRSHITGGLRPGIINRVRTDHSVTLSETALFDVPVFGVNSTDMREFRMLLVLVREAKRAEHPTKEDEIDVNHFTLPLFDRCDDFIPPEHQPALRDYYWSLVRWSY